MNNTKICIIKLGALGDVVRTIPILEAIKEKYPDSDITWITKESSKEILEDNKLINNLVFIPVSIEENFDILYSLDIDEVATKLAVEIKAEEKLGFYNNEGFPASFNEEAEYYLNTVFDDSLKKTNRKNYQEMIFSMCRLKWGKQPIILNIPEENKLRIKTFLEENDISNKKIIGLNIGSSQRWPSKAWSFNKIKEFIKKAKEKGYEIILLGGFEEIDSMKILSKNLEEENIIIYSKNTSNSLKDFFALVNICDIIVCADTLALHVAIAFKKQIIALFFCTPEWEIEGYGLIKKIVSPMFDKFFPERMDEYNEELVNSISVEEVLNVLEIE